MSPDYDDEERFEEDGFEECLDCRATLDAAADRGYRNGSWTLCSRCALDHGARFDEDEGYWIVPPDVTGLSGHRAHRMR